MQEISMIPRVSSCGTTLTSQETEFRAGAVSQEQEQVDEIEEREAQKRDLEGQHDATGHDDLEQQADTKTAIAKPEAKDAYLVNIVLGDHKPGSRC